MFAHNRSTTDLNASSPDTGWVEGSEPAKDVMFEQRTSLNALCYTLQSISVCAVAWNVQEQVGNSNFERGSTLRIEILRKATRQLKDRYRKFQPLHKPGKIFCKTFELSLLRLYT